MRGYLWDDVTPDELTHAVRTVMTGQSVVSCTPAGRFGERPRTSSVSARGLTARELEVLPLIERGLRNDQIAEALGISTNTAKNHVRNLFAKLGAHSRVEAVAQPGARRLLERHARGSRDGG